MSEPIKPPVPKLCVFCEHFRMDTEGWDTSGFYAVVSCWKNHWHSTSGIPGHEFQRQAETCPDYEERS